jgi:hypothetical protein
VRDGRLGEGDLEGYYKAGSSIADIHRIHGFVSGESL